MCLRYFALTCKRAWNLLKPLLSPQGKRCKKFGVSLHVQAKHRRHVAWFHTIKSFKMDNFRGHCIFPKVGEWVTRRELWGAFCYFKILLMFYPVVYVLIRAACYLDVSSTCISNDMSLEPTNVSLMLCWHYSHIPMWVGAFPFQILAHFVR